MKGSSGTPKYTVIMHEVRLSLGLSMTEYCIADTIYKLSTGPKSKVPGWCYASKKTLAETIGLSEKAIYTILNKLESNKIIERHDKTKNIKTTQKWYDNVVINTNQKLDNSTINTNQRLDNQTTVGITKGNIKTNQTTVDDTNQTTVPIYEDNNNLDKNKDNSPAGGPSGDEELEKKEKIELSKNIGTLIGIFEKKNPTPPAKSKNVYKIPANRDAAIYVLERSGSMEEAERLCNLAVSSSDIPYAPVVPNIYTMMLKWFDIISWDKRMRSPDTKSSSITEGTDFSEQAEIEQEKYIKERDERLAGLGKK